MVQCVVPLQHSKKLLIFFTAVAADTIADTADDAHAHSSVEEVIISSPCTPPSVNEK